MVTEVPEILRDLVDPDVELNTGPNSAHQRHVAEKNPDFSDIMLGVHDIAQQLELIASIGRHEDVGIIIHPTDVEPGLKQSLALRQFSSRTTDSQGQDISLN